MRRETSPSLSLCLPVLESRLSGVRVGVGVDYSVSLEVASAASSSRGVGGRRGEEEMRFQTLHYRK